MKPYSGCVARVLAVVATYVSSSACVTESPPEPCRVEREHDGREFFTGDSPGLREYAYDVDGRFVRAEQDGEVLLEVSYSDTGRAEALWRSAGSKRWSFVWDDDHLDEMQGLDGTDSVALEYADGLMVRSRESDGYPDRTFTYENRLLQANRQTEGSGWSGAYTFEPVGELGDCLSAEEGEGQYGDVIDSTETLLRVQSDGYPSLLEGTGSGGPVSQSWTYTGRCDALGSSLPEFEGHPYWFLQFGIPTSVCY